MNPTLTPCPRCPKDVPIDQCAFASGVFSSANWNCGTANVLRDAADKLEAKQAYNEDQRAVLLPNDAVCGSFILVSWYKRRGKTDMLALVNPRHSTEVLPLTLQQAEDYLRLNP